MFANEPPDAERRVFWWRHWVTEPARRTQKQPWLHVNAVVTMFDSGGSSGQLRDELGVLPPGDILKCALALSRNAREARKVLLARLPMLEHARLGGHTGGNLLLSMMQRYSGDFLDAVDGLSALLAAAAACGRSASSPRPCVRSTVTARRRARGRGRRGQSSGRFVRRIWLEPPVAIHPAVAHAIAIRCRHHRPGSFYTSLMPIFLVGGVADALENVKGRSSSSQPADRGPRHARLHRGRRRWAHRRGNRRKVDVVILNTKCHPAVLARYAVEHKEPLAPGQLPEHCELIVARSGPATSRGTIACGSPIPSGACFRSVCSPISVIARVVRRYFFRRVTLDFGAWLDRPALAVIARS